jgi:methionine-rich copper-binding protein CopC
MVLRRSAGFWLVLASVLIVQPAARAEELRVMDTGPVNDGVEQGRIDKFFVRFNQPVDHIKSDFVIMRGNQVVQVLQPRFDAEPNTLFAERSPLPPGNYTLVWTVKTIEGRPVAVGDIDFKVDSKR